MSRFHNFETAFCKILMNYGKNVSSKKILGKQNSKKVVDKTIGLVRFFCIISGSKFGIIPLSVIPRSHLSFLRISPPIPHTYPSPYLPLSLTLSLPYPSPIPPTFIKVF